MSSYLRFAALNMVALTAIGAGSVLAAPTPTQDDPAAVLAETKQSPNAKLGPWLDNLYQEYQEAKGKGVADKDFRSTNKALRVTRATVGLDAMATDGAALARSMKAMGATNVRNQGPLVSARVPVSALGKLAADPALKYARSPLAITEALPAKAVSQGDVSLSADLARTQSNVDGTGITVGVLSDSFACNPPAFRPGAPTSTKEQDQNPLRDELPPANKINILKDGSCPDGTDEGRAMAQLIHDVAPASSIAFHTAFESEFDFAEGIIRLRDAGADVIVDDVRYFAEPFFSDGMVAQAVDIVTAGGAGVPYFSSAGNSARESYESDYRPVNVLTNAGNNLNGGAAVVRRFHDFNPDPSPNAVQILQPVVVTPDGGAGVIVFSFQWDQPHKTATTYARIKAGQDPALAVGATTDLDIVVFDYKGHVVRRCPPGVSKGITCQVAGDRNVGGDAVDLSVIYYAGPPKQAQLFYIGFVYSGGDASADAVKRVKYTWSESQGSFGILQFATNSPTSYGHSNAAGNIAVGASSWYATVPFSTSGLVPPNDTSEPTKPRIALSLAVCNPACLNDFSSAGGIPILLDKFGNRQVAEIRRVPSVTGPDGGNTSFFFSDSSYDNDDGDDDVSNSPFSTFVSATLDRPGDEYPNFFGTSASAPHVAAVAALMLDKNPNLTQPRVRQILETAAATRAIDKRFTSARPIVTNTITPELELATNTYYNYDAGVGLVDAAAAVQAVPAP